jgi:acetoin utilization deacetylase AcuC-like enzyme
LIKLGAKEGLNHSVNVPLNPGITDREYIPLFKNIINMVIDRYNPTVIIY